MSFYNSLRYLFPIQKMHDSLSSQKLLYPYCTVKVPPTFTYSVERWGDMQDRFSVAYLHTRLCLEILYWADTDVSFFKNLVKFSVDQLCLCPRVRPPPPTPAVDPLDPLSLLFSFYLPISQRSSQMRACHNSMFADIVKNSLCLNRIYIKAIA